MHDLLFFCQRHVAPLFVDTLQTLRFKSLRQSDHLHTEDTFRFLTFIPWSQWTSLSWPPLIIRRQSSRRVVSPVWGIWKLSAWMEIPQSSYYPRCIIQPVSHWAKLIQNGAKWRGLKIHTARAPCFSWLTENPVSFPPKCALSRSISFFPASR